MKNIEVLFRDFRQNVEFLGTKILKGPIFIENPHFFLYIFKNSDINDQNCKFNVFANKQKHELRVVLKYRVHCVWGAILEKGTNEQFNMQKCGR